MDLCNICLLLSVLTSHQVLSETSTPPLNVSLPTCPDDVPLLTDFGDLTAPGTGRVLQLNNGRFEVDGEKVFLSGMNVRGGKTFGDDHYTKSQREYECYLRRVNLAGGNSLRTEVHNKAQATPLVENGRVTALDSKGSFISDIKKYLRAAAKHDIVIFLSLWDMRTHSADMDLLINGESALQSYIDNALIPLVKAVQEEPGLGGFNIMGQTDKLVLKQEVSVEPCFDTRDYHILNNGHYSMQNVLRFVSRQADAIHAVDPKIIVTTEASYDDTLSSVKGVNHFKNSCLLKAGGRPLGFLDFYSLASLHGNREHFQLNATDFHTDKPLLLSSFSETNGHGLTSPEQFQWAYFHGYSGAWSWYATTEQASGVDSMQTQERGLESIRYETDPLNGGVVSFSLSKYVVSPHHGLSGMVGVH